MGSDSDLPVMFPAARILDRFQIPYELMNVSTHRMLGWLVEYLVARGERGSHLGMIGIQFGNTVKALHFDHGLSYM
jgi:phosphoribosylaminoimidazole carboxylase